MSDNERLEIKIGILILCIGAVVSACTAIKSRVCPSSKNEDKASDGEESWNDIEASIDSNTDEPGISSTLEGSAANSNMSGAAYKSIAQSSSSSFPFDAEDFRDDLNIVPCTSNFSRPNNSNCSECSPSISPLPSKIESTKSLTLIQSLNTGGAKTQKDSPLTLILSPQHIADKNRDRTGFDQTTSNRQSPSTLSDLSCDHEEHCTGFSKNIVEPFEDYEEDNSDGGSSRSSNCTESLSHPSFIDHQNDEDFLDKGYEVDDDGSTSSSLIFKVLSASSCDESGGNCSGSKIVSVLDPESFLGTIPISNASQSSHHEIDALEGAKILDNESPKENEASTTSVLVLEDPESFLDTASISTASQLSQYENDALEGTKILDNEDGSLPGMTDADSTDMTGADSISWDFSSAGSFDKSGIDADNDSLKENDASTTPVSVLKDPESFLDTPSISTSSQSTQYEIDALEGAQIYDHEIGCLPEMTDADSTEMTDADSISWDFSSAGSCDKSTESLSGENNPAGHDDLVVEKIPVYAGEDACHRMLMVSGEIGMI